MAAAEIKRGVKRKRETSGKEKEVILMSKIPTKLNDPEMQIVSRKTSH